MKGPNERGRKGEVEGKEMGKGMGKWRGEGVDIAWPDL